MKIFNELTQDERDDISNRHISTELIVNRETLGFENIENLLPAINQQPNEYFSVPQGSMSDKIAETESHERWRQMAAKIQMEKGLISYKKIDDDYFAAKIVF